MPSPQLSHHLRANRKRLALSQDDVAFLLGNESGAQVSRYEHFDRVPTLETALAYEVIMKRSASELFGGMYLGAERKVAERAKALMQQMTDVTGPRAARRRSVLADLAELSH
jgi:transcriptional regulator with XRE-family HTH domain